MEKKKKIQQLDITRIVTAGKQLEVIDPIPEGVNQLILNVEDIPEQGLVQVFDEVCYSFNVVKFPVLKKKKKNSKSGCRIH